MPKIVGEAVQVVNNDGLVIHECVGNVATHDDTLSLARVQVHRPTSEPWLTLDYDEWIVVTRGSMELHTQKDGDDGVVLTVKQGETALVSKGERIRPVFAEGNTEYIAACLPAFRPDRCIREEAEESEVSMKLQQLHSKNSSGKADDTEDDMEVLYHMCQKSLWDAQVAAGAPYFPPTFRQDGMFIHATAVPERLIQTANHFYKGVQGDWICIQLSRSALYKLGIDTIFEQAKPVGDTDAVDNSNWVFPHIYGGIPTCVKRVVTNTYSMKRDFDGSFVLIEGLTDQ